MKCGDKTTKGTLHKHLVQCHGFGLMQCVFCRFGTNTFEIMSSHIANNHPSRLPLFCERTEYKAPLASEAQSYQTASAPSSIESTCLKHINQQVNAAYLLKAPSNEVALRNYGSIGQLGINVHIRGVENPQNANKTKVRVIASSELDPANVTQMPQPDKRSLAFRATGKATFNFKPTSMHHQPVATSSSQSTSANASVDKPMRIYQPLVRKAVPKSSSGLQIQSVFSLSDKSSINTLYPPDSDDLLK